MSGSEGVSAPGAVTIAIGAPAVLPGKLAAPAELDFPTVVTGERSTVEMELANEGRGVLEVDAMAPPPWSIEGGGSYKIDPGAKLTLKVAFQTDKAGIVAFRYAPISD